MFFFWFIYSFFIDKLICAKFYLLVNIFIIFFFNFIKLKIFTYKNCNIKLFNFSIFLKILIYQTLAVIKIPNIFLKIPNIFLNVPNIFLFDFKINFKNLFWREFLHIDISNGLLEFAFFYYVPIKKNYVLDFSKIKLFFYPLFYFQNFYINYTVYTNIFLTFIFATLNYLFNYLSLYNFFYIIFNFKIKNFDFFNFIKLNFFLVKISELQLHFFIFFIWLFFYFYLCKYNFNTIFNFIIVFTNKIKKLKFFVNNINVIIYIYMYANLFIRLLRLYILNFIFSLIKKFSGLFKLFNLKIKKIYKLKFLIYKLKIYNFYKNYK